MSTGSAAIPIPSEVSVATRRVGPYCWTVRSDINDDSLRPLLENPEQFLHEPAHHLKDSDVVTITRVPGGAGEKNLILRRLNYDRFPHPLRDFFRASRAQRAFHHALWLEAAGIRTPRALAACDVRTLRWPRAAYLITEEVPEAVTLAKLFHERFWIPPKAMRKLAKLLARMHNHGLSHRDLKWTNILYTPQLEPWLIDLDGVRRFGRLPDEQARLDLATLGVCFATFPKILNSTGCEFVDFYCAERLISDQALHWRTELARLLPP